MSRYHGKTGMAYISITGTGNAVAVVGLSEWSLNMGADREEVTAFGDGNKQYVQGYPDISGDLSGFWDDTSDALYDGMQSSDGVKMYLYPSTLTPAKYWYGSAWVDFEINTAVGGGVTIGGSFQAAGVWGQY